MNTISHSEQEQQPAKQKYSPEICLQVAISTAAVNLIDLTGRMKMVGFAESELDQGIRDHFRRKIIKEMREHVRLCREALATYEAAPDRAVEGPLA